MPLTDFQYELGRLLAGNRSEDSYLAGGTVILLQPNTKRISQLIRNSNSVDCWECFRGLEHR